MDSRVIFLMGARDRMKPGDVDGSLHGVVKLDIWGINVTCAIEKN